MAQTDYKLKTTRSREDFQYFQIAILKYDPQHIQDVHLYLSPDQHIRAQTIFGKIILKEAQKESQEVAATNFQPLSIHLSGKVDSLYDHFQRMEDGGNTYYHLKSPQKKGNLPLLYLRECDHIPREETFLNCSIPGQSTKKNRYPNSVTVCDLCEAPLWKYYDKQEISISLKEICNINTINNIQAAREEFSWSIVLNEQFTQTTEIAKLGGQDINLPYLAKASFLLNFQEHGKKLKDNTVVIKIRKVICKHEKIIEDRCQFCMEQIKQEHLNQLTSYLFQNQTNRGNVLMTGQALKHQEEIFIENLLSSHKGMIILDLDNTILHSNEISQLDIKTVLALKDFYLIPKIECQMQDNGKKDLIVVKMRPYFKHFIYVITKLYEIYVYTKGTRVYAQEICKYIRAQYAGQERTHPYLTWQPQKLLFLQNKKSFATNIISRDEDSNLQSKSFDKILPSKTQYHLILDDRRDVWNNSPAWFFTREYYYFFKRQMKPEEVPFQNEDISHYLTTETVALPEFKLGLLEEYMKIRLQYPQKISSLHVDTNKSNDYFLLYAAYALKKIHRHFFEAIKAGKQEGEKEVTEEQKGRKINKMNLSYQYAKTKYFFKQMKFQCFLGEDQNQNNNNTVRRAKKMGAIITNESPTVIIRANDLMKQTKKPQLLIVPPTEDSKMAEQPNPNYYMQEKKELGRLFSEKVPVVSESWIHYCYEFHYPFKWEEFRLYDPYQMEVSHQSFNQIIEREGKAILKSFEDEMIQDLNEESSKHHAHHIHLRHKKDKIENERHSEQN